MTQRIKQQSSFKRVLMLSSPSSFSVLFVFLSFNSFSIHKTTLNVVTQARFYFFGYRDVYVCVQVPSHVKLTQQLAETRMENNEEEEKSKLVPLQSYQKTLALKFFTSSQLSCTMSNELPMGDSRLPTYKRIFDIYEGKKYYSKPPFK